MANKVSKRMLILLLSVCVALVVGLIVAIVVLSAMAAPSGMLPISVAVLGGVLAAVGLAGGLVTLYLWRLWRQ